ncbi:MAG: hypothetical protein QG594_1498 [Bacteroidota bacterium]|nr:hypothetical protein [Bacteroidota bacterium]
MKKIQIICSDNIAVASHIVRIVQQEDTAVIVENNIEDKNIVNSAFEPEPLMIIRTYKEDFDVKINDFPRNKFFDKPKNNFKKR